MYIEDPYDDDGDDDDYYRCLYNGCEYRSVCKGFPLWLALIIVMVVFLCSIPVIIQIVKEECKCIKRREVAATKARLAKMEPAKQEGAQPGYEQAQPMVKQPAMVVAQPMGGQPTQ